MAGIYIHIPFCKTRCIYCDFYSTTHEERKEAYIRALCRELKMRKDYLKGEKIGTVYFGGGTPSRLSEEDFGQVFETIRQTYGLDACEEITLEANPDDLTEDYVNLLRRLPFNRISIGIQTFDDAMLKLLNRRHTALQAIEAVERCRRLGFDNISIDLIYGLPNETEERWKRDLRLAVDLDVEHISAYHLTYKKGTRLYRLLQSGDVYEVNEESSVHFFTMLTDALDEAGYEHYEISNFSKPGRRSRHNTSYWQGVPYLGCGPSAHSFDTQSREWNIALLEKYIGALEQGERLYEREELSLTMRYNEYVMTSLRTREGIDLDLLACRFGPQLASYCERMAKPYKKSHKLKMYDRHLRLTRAGIFTSDGIISDLMFVE